MTQPYVYLELSRTKVEVCQKKEEEEKRGVEVVDILQDEKNDPTVVVDLFSD